MIVNGKSSATLERCEIRGAKGECVYMLKGSSPRLRDCKLVDGKRSGVVATDQTEGLFENCEITGCANGGIVLRQQSHPTFYKCKIQNNKTDGVYVDERSRGVFELCEISGNEGELTILSGADPYVYQCKILGGKAGGVYFSGSAKGTLNDCDISDFPSGIMVREKATPLVQNCRITRCKTSGVDFANAGGELRDCEIFGNEKFNVVLGAGGSPEFTRCKIHSKATEGVRLLLASSIVMTDCEIYDHAECDIHCSGESRGSFVRCTIRSSPKNGLWINEKAKATVVDAQISDHGNPEVLASGEAQLTIQGGSIKTLKSNGLLTRDSALVVVGNCTIETTDSEIPLQYASDSSRTILRDCKLSGAKCNVLTALEKGTLEAERCRVSGGTLNTVFVSKSAHAWLRDCVVSGSQASGARVLESGELTLDKCEFSGNQVAGVNVEKDGRLIARNSTFKGNRECGVQVAEGAEATIEGSTAEAGSKSAWSILQGAKLAGTNNTPSLPTGFSAPATGPVAPGDAVVKPTSSLQPIVPPDLESILNPKPNLNPLISPNPNPLLNPNPVPAKPTNPFGLSFMPTPNAVGDDIDAFFKERSLAFGVGTAVDPNAIMWSSTKVASRDLPYEPAGGLWSARWSNSKKSDVWYNQTAPTEVKFYNDLMFIRFEDLTSIQMVAARVDGMDLKGRIYVSLKEQPFAFLGLNVSSGLFAARYVDRERIDGEWTRETGLLNFESGRFDLRRQITP